MLYLLISAFVLLSCTEDYQAPPALISDISSTSIDFEARVLDQDGNALLGVVVSLAYQNISTTSNAQGLFRFAKMQENNDMFVLKKEGYYDGIYSYSPQSALREFRLDAKNAKTQRLLFTGDLSFARRFMRKDSPDRTAKLIQKDDPLAILKVSALRHSGQALIAPIKPLFESVDFPTVNFESIATRSQSTLDMLHPSKDFAYYTDSFSIGLLKDLGVSFVTLGNNHVYDYQREGLSDTLKALKENNISFSGAGESVAKAFEPHHQSIKNKDFSFIGATSIRGDRHKILYVAHEQNLSDSEDIFLTQGGAGDAKDTHRLASLFKREKALGFFPIYQFHGGIEYTFAPNSIALKLISHAKENNASLVISHHPHTAQGYGYDQGIFMAYGMGNFIFDQDRLDTLLSHIIVCDISEDKISKARGYPIYIENYTPKLLTGDVANRFIRHISEASRNGSTLIESKLPSDLLVYPYEYKEYISLNNQHKTLKKYIKKTIEISDKGYAIVDLRSLSPSQYSLSHLSNAQNNTLSFQMGRDLLWFGSFEDMSVDQTHFANSIWNFSDALASSAIAHTGKASAHIYRNQSHRSDALLYFGRRIRVIGDARDHPNKDLSFFGYFKGNSSRPFSIESKYYASIEEKAFGSQMLFEEEGGTFDWKPFEAPLAMPKDTVSSKDPKVYLSQNARALKFYIRMQKLEKGEAHLYVDDLAIINWEETQQNTATLSTPHAREFIKVSGKAGTYILDLEFTAYRP